MESAASDDPGRQRLVTVNFEYYCIGLVDVLSQRAALAEWETLPDEPAANLEFWKRIQGSVGVVYNLRETIVHMVRAFAAQSIDSGRVATLPEPLRSEYLQAKVSRLQTQFFSDTTVFFSPMKQVASAPLLRDTAGMILGIGMLMPILFSRGVAIRGAIDIGAATDAFRGEIYGPGLAMAYHLEQEVADYPRIVIGRRLYSQLSDVSELTGEAPFVQVARRMAKDLLRAFFIDDDGVLALHYLGDYFKEVASHSQARSSATDHRFTELVQKAHLWIASEHGRFQRALDAKLARRYARLRRYFDAEAGRWK